MLYAITNKLLIEATDTVDINLDVETYADENKKTLFLLLKSVTVGMGARIGALISKDFYQGLIGKDAFNTGRKVRDFLIGLYKKTVGRAVKKFAVILRKAFNIAYRHMRKPKAIAGFLMMVAGLMFMALGNAKIDVNSTDLVKPATVKSVAKTLSTKFNQLFRNRYSKIGVTLFTIGAGLFIWSFF